MVKSQLAPAHALKYPRTPHLPESPGATSDDKWIDANGLTYLASGIELVATEKLDGGNLTFYRDYFHGRSLDSGTHAWDTMARAEWARVRHEIPEGYRLSGESMYARRSVAYENLPGVFILFGIWNERNEALGWSDVEEWADLLGLPHVPVLYRGNDFQAAVTAWGKVHSDVESEGFVVRDAGSFAYGEFETHVAKWVRAGHVRTSADWRHRDDFPLNTFINNTNAMQV